MELKDSTVAELNQLKEELSETQFRLVIRFLNKESKELKKSSYLECLQYVADIDPNKINYAVIYEPNQGKYLIDPDELQYWRSNHEHYRVEVRYCNHDQGTWIPYPNLIAGFDNAILYQPGDFYEKFRIVRLYDNRIIHEEDSKVFKLHYSDGHYDFATNCSYRMAESIGAARCRKNGTDFAKLVITETQRKSNK